jgi:hypothetical protein
MQDDIKNVSDYIKHISRLISEKSDDTIVVYRGENQIYSTHCQPNLFRGDHLKKNEHFEKSLFDEMTANKLTNGESYLEKAIDAQHGGFPSRLLDVTYNSLVALYFATTPDPTKPEDAHDKKDGVVYIYFIKKLFCPSGDNINSIYDSIVKRDNKWFSTQSIFQKNHKLIDHIKTNKRIIAQQGAFILFQGDMVSPIPESDYKKITISGIYKSNIRRELKDFFGIHTGSIYPEPNNLVKHITGKSYMISSKEFEFDTELDLVINNLERELEFFSDIIIGQVYNKRTTVDLARKVTKIEEVIFSYKNGILELSDEFINKTGDVTKQKKIMEIASRYNDLLSEFYESINYYILDIGIDFSFKELMIGE